MPSVAAATATPIPRRGRSWGRSCCSHPHSRRNLLQLPRLPLLLLFSVGGAQAGTCPGGSAGLTRALYEGGDPAAYANVTCIPREEFQTYEGDVVLKGLALLTSIEEQAFYEFKGTLAITGDFPALETVGERAFQSAGNTESKVDLSGLNSAKVKSIHYLAFNDFKGSITLPTRPFPNYKGCTRMGIGMASDLDVVLHAPTQIPLTKTLYEAAAAAGGGERLASFSNVTCIPDAEFRDYAGGHVILDTGLESLHSIGVGAFSAFKGRLAIAGEYPALETVGAGAFNYAGNIESAISFNGLPLLKMIEYGAFNAFKGTLAIAGGYPSLEKVGVGAFQSTGNTESAITFSGLPLLKAIEKQAFYEFIGTLAITGEFPALETVREFAFSTAGNTESKVDLSGLNSAKLKSIHFMAFNDFKGSITLPTGPFPNYTGGCNRMFGITPDPDVVLHAPTQIPLTKTLYGVAAAVGGGERRTLISNVTCVPDAEFRRYAGGRQEERNCRCVKEIVCLPPACELLV